MLSFSAGPLALSLDRLLLLIALGITLVVGWLLGRRRLISVEPVITQMLLWGLAGARVSFVLLYLDDYRAKPLSMLDVRDGGFLLEAGLVVAAIVGLYHGWRKRPIRLPLGAAVAAGALTCAVSLGALNLMQATQPTLPDLPLVTLENNTQSLVSFSGRPLVVNLWATWCPPCRREMPVLAAAQQRETGVEFLFINQGEARAAVADYLQNEQLALHNVLLDPHVQLGQHMGSQALPTTLFFDASGKLVNGHLGELSSASLRHALEQILPAERAPD